MLNLLIQEYIGICGFLEKCQERKTGNRYFKVRREVMEELFNKNPYETAEQKLRYWKMLGWISAEERRCTRRVYDRETKHYYPYVMIHVQIYRCIRDLQGKKIEWTREQR